MKMSKTLRRFLEAAKKSNTYWVEKTKLDFSLKLEERRRARDMSYKDLAKAAEVSQPYVTKVFRGDVNLTIESMVKFARATGGRVEISIVDIAAQQREEIEAFSPADVQAFAHPVARGQRATLSVLASSSTTATSVTASNSEEWRQFQLAA